MEFLDALKIRRSQYNITNTSKLSDDEILEVVREGIKHTPSPMDSQTTRAVVLFNENHKKLWEITKEKLLEKIGPERFKKTEEKIDSQFLAGYGTILFFQQEDEIKKGAEETNENFYSWSDQSAGMTQGNIWVGLSEKGLGASLQHYNPLIDEDVKKEFSIPKEWRLMSQMPFGDIVSPPKKKEYRDIDDLVKVRKWNSIQVK